MVKIGTVTYKRLMSVEKFGNISLEAVGHLEEGEDRDEAYEEVRRWVDLQLNTRKLAIEGKLSQPDDEEDSGYFPAARAQQFPTPAQVGQVIGSGSVQSNQISSQQIIGQNGKIVAQARGMSIGGGLSQGQQSAFGLSGDITLQLLTNPGQPAPAPATAQVSYPPLTIPPGGRQEVDLDPHGDALLTIYDAQDQMQGQPLTLDGRTASTLIADQGKGLLQRTHTGAIAYTPSNFLTEQQPQGGWLQVHEGRGASPYDTLEYMNWGGRINRAMARGWAATALSRGLLVARQGAPGLRFGVSEGAFWAAAPPTPFDDATDDDDERPEDEAFAADWEEDSADFGTVDCSNCQGSGFFTGTDDALYECARCEGTGQIPAIECDDCNGSGVVEMPHSDTNPKPDAWRCGACQGSGVVPAPERAAGVTCPDCMGSGCYSDESDSRNCPRCGGSGSVEPIAMVV